VGELREEPGQEALRRHRARDVWDHDRDAVSRADQVAEGPRADRPPHRLPERGRLVAETLHEPRPDHRDVGGVGHEVEAVRAVLKMEALHRRR
jgi:hypothetical protein